jgi:hypothetical protein
MKTVFLLLILAVMYPGKRQVLIFFNQNGSALKDEQIRLLNKNNKGLLERNIIIHSYNTNFEKEKMKEWNVSPDADYTFILSGKDGGEKYRSDTLVSTQELFAVIDAMPMRKREMEINRNKTKDD